ncbi:uncharacterized protein LOC117565651 [Drosophila albomicans]|uniref:Uncharacterized protein LOC117565651 n=1 Tax=Drosophila albomicans TaxID=7291 RepID=A0A6P8WRD7_DROAB|nr:uncharacterized protein LOC117565651 [Drosophila albomicans]XP_034100755.1 uncharacterized protein LOC117565651 [Drosophila albomicans]XP_051857886.1 uncharacterized protein LOC117565651 [Drosophila albomicans]
MTSKQLLIFILLLIPWPPSNVIKILCSRDNSRLVRKIVRSKWTPILDKHQVKLPLECPLHPLRDVFAPRQDEKQRDRPTQWTCRRCGKSFYQEKYLDLHFDTRHKSIINEAEDSVCLADFCDIMRCEVFETEDASSLKFGDQHIVTDIEVWGDSLGQNSALAKANAAYLSLIPRTSTLSATRAAKVQNRQLLQEKPSQSREQSQQSEAAATAATAAGEEPKSAAEKLLMKLKELGQAHLKRTEPESKSKAEPKQNKTDEEGEEHSGDAEGSGQPNAATKTPHGEGAEAANGQAKVRANCKPEELSKLKSRCELLLRGCIGGLLLSMSDQSFKEMEEEMNKAVCWYLTCDRYWEDGPLEPRAFPWGLIVILIFVLSTGICFCYYIIWILFDSEETTINANSHYAGAAVGGSIYMPAPHHHYHVDYATHHPHELQQQHQQLDGVAIPGRTVADQQQQQQQLYYPQQQQQQVAAAAVSARDLYPEPVQYHRHSPRHYIADQRPAGAASLGSQGTPTSSAGVRQVGASSSNANTPLHHRHSTSLVYPQDILDRRDYTNSSSRPIATSVVNNASAAAAAAGEPPRHYNTHPRPLETRHRHVGASQQSLRTSSSTHEIVQSEIGGGQNEHYIYVTYPPDLKKRYFDKYE